MGHPFIVAEAESDTFRMCFVTMGVPIHYQPCPIAWLETWRFVLAHG